MTLRQKLPMLAATAATTIAFLGAAAPASADGPGRRACAQAQRAINTAEWHLERVTDAGDIAYWNGILFANLNYRNTYCNF